MNNNAGDHRTRVTKMLIRNAYLNLLQNKPLQNITVKELCSIAGINRSTFYAHYTDLYDLTDQIENEMFEHFKDSLNRLLTLPSASVNPVEVSTGIFQCLKDNADLCTVTLGIYGNKDFARKLIQYGREKCLKAYAVFFKDADREQLEYYYAFVCDGCIGLLKQWLAEGMSAAPEQMAQTAESIMMYGIGFLNRDSHKQK